MLNKVIIAGRLVRDPECKVIGETKNAKFTIANDSDYTNKKTGEKDTAFVEIEAWRSTADFVEKYFTKGRMAIVSGRLSSRKYQDKEGNNRTAWSVVADSVYFGDSKSGGEKPTPATQTQTDFSEVAAQFETLLDDDGGLPF